MTLFCTGVLTCLRLQVDQVCPHVSGSLRVVPDLCVGVQAIYFGGVSQWQAVDLRWDTQQHARALSLSSPSTNYSYKYYYCFSLASIQLQFSLGSASAQCMQDETGAQTKHTYYSCQQHSKYSTDLMLSITLFHASVHLL